MLTVLREQLRQLNALPDIVAYTYLRGIYHLSSAYGLEEIMAEIKDSAEKIFGRLDRKDPIRLHYFLMTMGGLPSLCSPTWISELEAAVRKLDMPKLTYDAIEMMKVNIDDYIQKTEPNQAPQTTICTVTDRAPSSTLRASADRV
jgi:hypothetical protein